MENKLLSEASSLENGTVPRERARSGQLPGARTQAGRRGRCSWQRGAPGHEEQKTRLALAGLWEMNQTSHPCPTLPGWHPPLAMRAEAPACTTVLPVTGWRLPYKVLLEMR